MENMKELRAQLARHLKGVERILKIGMRDFDDSFRDNEVYLGHQVRYNQQFSFGRSVISGEVYNCIHIRNIFFDPNKYGESLQVYIERIMGEVKVNLRALPELECLGIGGWFWRLSEVVDDTEYPFEIELSFKESIDRVDYRGLAVAIICCIFTAAKSVPVARC